MEYPFIAIALRPTLTRSGNTWSMDQMFDIQIVLKQMTYGKNRIVRNKTVWSSDCVNK